MNTPYVGVSTLNFPPLPVNKYWEHMRRDNTKNDPQYVIAYHLMRLATMPDATLPEAERVSMVYRVVGDILDSRKCNLFKMEERLLLPLNFTLNSFKDFMRDRLANSPPYFRLMDNWAVLKCAHIYQSVADRVDAIHEALVHKNWEQADPADLDNLIGAKARLDEQFASLKGSGSLVIGVERFRILFLDYLVFMNRGIAALGIQTPRIAKFNADMQAAISKMKGADDPLVCIKSIVCGLPVVAIMRTDASESPQGTNRYGYIVDVKEAVDRVTPPRGDFNRNLTYRDIRNRTRRWLPSDGLTEAAALEFTDTAVNGLNAVVVFKHGSYFEMPLVHALVLHLAVENTMGSAIDPGYATIKLTKVAAPLSAFLNRVFPSARPNGTGDVLQVRGTVASADCYGTGVPFSALGPPFVYTDKNVQRLLDAFRIMRAAGGDPRNGAAPLPPSFDAAVKQLRADILATLPRGASSSKVLAAHNELLAYSDVFGFFVNAVILRPPTREDDPETRRILEQSPKLASDLYFAHDLYTGAKPVLAGGEAAPASPSPYWEFIKSHDNESDATQVEFGGVLPPVCAYDFMVHTGAWLSDPELDEDEIRDRVSRCFDSVTNYRGAPAGFLWTFSQMVMGLEEGGVYKQVVEREVVV